MTKSKISQDDLPLAERYAIPNCDSLEHKILQKTSALSQQPIEGSSKQPVRGRSILQGVLKHEWMPTIRPKPIVAMSIIAVVAVILFKVQLTPYSNSSPDENAQQQLQAQSASQSSSMNQLDWQELLLLQDEMAFASL